MKQDHNVMIKELEPSKMQNVDWDIYHIYRTKRHFEKNPDDSISENEDAEKGMLANLNHPEAEMHYFLIIDILKNIQIGSMMYAIIKEDSPSYEGMKDIISFNIEFLRDRRTKELEDSALEQLYKFAVENQKVILITNSAEIEGRQFFKRIGAQEALAGTENRLQIKDVDWNLIKEWEAHGLQKSKGTSIHFYKKIPDEIIESFCKTYTEIVNQQPFEELEIGKMVFTPETYRQQEQIFESMDREKLLYLSIESDGTISGLTEMLYNPKKETMIEQMMTGVNEKYRGRGLGKLLKARMLLTLQEKYPNVERITTSNATSNAPMLSINNRLGFKLYKEDISAQITTEALGHYLSSNL